MNQSYCPLPMAYELNDKVWEHSELGSPLMGHGTVASLESGAWVWYGHDLISWAAQGMHWVSQVWMPGRPLGQLAWWEQQWSVASESQVLQVQLAKAVPVVQAWQVQAVVQRCEV